MEMGAPYTGIEPEGKIKNRAGSLKD